MSGLTKVELVSDVLGKRAFTIEHAQNILDYEKGKGLKNWQLSPGNGFELDNGTIKRASKRADQGSKERTETSEGDPSRT